MMRAASILGLAAAGLALGCSKSSEPPPLTADMFVRATPIIEGSIEQSPRPASSTGAPSALPELAPPPEDLEVQGPAIEMAPPAAPAAAPSTDARRTLPSPTSTPTAVIAEANRAASQAPEADGFLNAVMTYNYVPGGIYQIFAAPENVTDLVLEPGEEIMGEPAAGDTLRWRLGVGSSAAHGVPQKHVFIKPTRAGLRTNLTINTNRRTYFLKLESLEKDFMVAVQWNYPGREESMPALAPPARGARRDAVDTARPADAAALNFDYVVEVVKGRPAWQPRAVFDDGQKTFIRFDPAMLHGESPALFVIERGELQIVNYRVKKNLYVVDRLFRVAELRLGQDEQDIIRIRRTGASAAPTSRPQQRSLRPYGGAR